ncbi:hypothetical protein LK542_04515 [Massilia sp. IC2-477]|uniref:GspMb/PilO family protein n=1 Tax=Massilia sp. IC2-477 TaxID=2887198 RepID=UPI001D0F8D80|nr:GspMb/PilO family protein [Massilia sp. IC2-477]MCC2954877.1 hypothetical protein [Massilia sp. IC2-477]
MNGRWTVRAAALPLRQLHLAGAGLLLIFGSALWFYALRAPLTQLRTVRTEHARLAQAGSDPRLLQAQLAALGIESEALARKLGGAQLGASGPIAPLVVQLIGDVNRLARQHRVALRGSTPATEQKTMVFTQYGIDAEATGSYADLLAWMEAIERSRPNLAIDRFEMSPDEASGAIHIRLRIAAYRPLEPNS